jgi:glycosyltransferase involved in cell wall biosynthesis
LAKLTILLPACNVALFIGEAIESLLHQTFKDFELWVVDDASTDQTLSIARSFNDPRIQIFTNEINKGFVATVNERVPHIQTQYFTITGADDVSNYKRLEKQIAMLESDPGLMMCGTSYWAMNEKGFFHRKMILKSDPRELRNHSLDASQFLGGTTIMRKEVLHHFHDFYRTYFSSNYSDADLACRIVDKYKATNIQEPLYFYRIVESSMSRKSITPRSLNIYKLIGHLSQQRREAGYDCLERQKPHEADQWLGQYLMPYQIDPSFIYRHKAFFHLYWGLFVPAILSVIKALQTKPFKRKNLLAFAYIIFKSSLFSVNRILFKKHYRSLISF